MLATFSHRPEGEATPVHPAQPKRRILITGASGKVGHRITPLLAPDYTLRLQVLDAADPKSQEVGSHGELVEARLQNLERLKEICADMDTVVHLAANPSTLATWEELHENNFIGVYHMLTAAKAAGVRRVILASSIHAVSGYPRRQQVKTHEPVRPGNLYGVSKNFAESIARHMAENEGLSCIALRIGYFQVAERVRDRMKPSDHDIWTSPRDLAQMLRLCIEHPTLRFAVFHALSNNRYNRLDISDAREILGYAPVDDAFALCEPVQEPEQK